MHSEVLLPLICRSVNHLSLTRMDLFKTEKMNSVYYIANKINEMTKYYLLGSGTVHSIDKTNFHEHTIDFYLQLPLPCDLYNLINLKQNKNTQHPLSTRMPSIPHISYLSCPDRPSRITL